MPHCAPERPRNGEKEGEAVMRAGARASVKGWPSRAVAHLHGADEEEVRHLQVPRRQPPPRGDVTCRLRRRGRHGRHHHRHQHNRCPTPAPPLGHADVHVTSSMMIRLTSRGEIYSLNCNGSIANALPAGTWVSGSVVRARGRGLLAVLVPYPTFPMMTGHKVEVGKFGPRVSHNVGLFAQIK